MTEKAYKIVSAEDLQKHPVTAAIGKMLLLNDNLEEEVDWSDPKTKTFMNKSIKLSSTMIIFLCLGGELWIKQGAQEVCVKKNDVLFVRSGVLSEVMRFHKDVKFALIIMDEKFYFPMFTGFDISNLQTSLTTKIACTLSDADMQECVALYKMMKERINTRRYDSLQKETIRGYLQAITFIVYSNYVKRNETEQRKAVAQNRQQEIYGQFMKQLQENYTQERKIAWYADKLCVTPRYLSRVIHDISGHFASEHIDLFVIAEAKHLLRSKKYTVLQVSEMLNFTSQSLFSRFFKNMTSFSPRDYQQQEVIV